MGQSLVTKLVVALRYKTLLNKINITTYSEKILRNKINITTYSENLTIELHVFYTLYTHVKFCVN